MKTIELPTDKSQIDMWMIRNTSMALLGQDLVPSDSHDEEGAMMTENQGYYFVPCDDDFVMSHPTILSPSKPTDKPRWRVEVVQVENNYPHEPDDYDLVEVGERSDALIRAIEQATIYDAQVNIQNIGEGVFWAAENLKEKLGYYEHWNIDLDNPQHIS